MLLAGEAPPSPHSPKPQAAQPSPCVPPLFVAEPPGRRRELLHTEVPTAVGRVGRLPLPPAPGLGALLSFPQGVPGLGVRAHRLGRSVAPRTPLGSGAGGQGAGTDRVWEASSGKWARCFAWKGLLEKGADRELGGGCSDGVEGSGERQEGGGKQFEGPSGPHPHGRVFPRQVQNLMARAEYLKEQVKVGTRAGCVLPLSACGCLSPAPPCVSPPSVFL